MVLQSDVKDPPIFRGDESDRFTVHEWEELMDMYLRKRCVPIVDQSQEILSKLLGKAKDIVKIALRSNLSLNPVNNPKVIYDVLNHHFSDNKYSCMPVADFYITLPVAGENPVEYWVRLNKAVDVAQEGLRRFGRQSEAPCQEATMMFVKHCPDPDLSSIFRLKSPDKRTAAETQEQLDCVQSELKERKSSKSKHLNSAKNAIIHVQTSGSDEKVRSDLQTTHVSQSEAVTTSAQADDKCMKTLVSLLDRVLTQNSHTASMRSAPDQAFVKRCKVCDSGHLTLAYCRRQHLSQLLPARSY